MREMNHRVYREKKLRKKKTAYPTSVKVYEVKDEFNDCKGMCGETLLIYVYREEETVERS